MNLLRLLRVVAALPGRLVIRWLDSISYPRLTRPLRASVHVLVWVLALMAVSMATVSTAIPPPAAQVVRTVPRYVPPAVPTFTPPSTPPSTAPSTAGDEPAEPVYVPLPDDGDDDWDKPRICHRKWWC